MCVLCIYLNKDTMVSHNIGGFRKRRLNLPQGVQASSHTDFVIGIISHLLHYLQRLHTSFIVFMSLRVCERVGECMPLDRRRNYLSS